MILAEKYRPTTFDEVVGHRGVIAAIKHYLSGAGGQPFLITGPSGTGKTTLAACAARHFGATDFDVHRVESRECSVDRLRQLAASMSYYGGGKDGRKAYVIDEIHTITGAAADRLLSLLESIPDHVIVVATTTETDWTDGILLSRWIRFDLDPVDPADVAARLESIAESEGLPIPADAGWADDLAASDSNIRTLINQLPRRLLAAAA